jgi:hypothetical protein
MNAKGRDERERAVVQFWRKGHLSWNTIQVYLSWVRRFRAYCLRRDLIEADELSLVGVRRFTSTYAGPRLKGKALARPTCDSAHNAIHSWNCALRALGETLPAWDSAPATQALPPLLDEYREYRRAHNGVAEGTLLRDLDVAQRFHRHLRERRRTICTPRLVDLDTFVQTQQSHVDGDGGGPLQLATIFSEIPAGDRTSGCGPRKECCGAARSQRGKAAADTGLAGCETYSPINRTIRATGQTRLRDPVAAGDLWPWRC